MDISRLAVREIKNTWIPLSDGCRLAARLWLPEDAEDVPVPAILEYLPYRKNDGTALRDALNHPFFAAHGYAAVRVDMRGSGDSDGILLDEYLPQEQDDGLEVLAWIAAQPWCTGAVGMIGISWGGFNGLQIASRRPPALKAVISLCSTDDRYADDCHYMGGCLLGSDMLVWASTMLAYNVRPPDPAHVGARWREMWLDRLENTPPFIEAWFQHQRRDAFWKHGSVCEDYSAIDCPVYVVGGWNDAYTNAIPRLLQGLAGPKKGLIGPWSHNYPNRGAPGPAIGFLHECVRWWDHWLKGVETGIMDEPMLRVWLLDSVPPASYRAEWPGRWIAEPAWPAPDTSPCVYYLGEAGLTGKPPADTGFEFTGSQLAGLASSVWCGHGSPVDLPGDQRADDGLALTFDGQPAEAVCDILGYPEVTVRLSVDRPNALIAVRLTDVAATGASTLVTWGLLNLTHHESHEHPAPLTPGKVYTANLKLNAVGYSLPAGHHWRLAISPTYWPHAWPSPEPVTLRIYGGEASRLTLPVRIAAQEEPLPPFGPPDGAAPLGIQVTRSGSTRRSIQLDPSQGAYTVTETFDRGEGLLIASGLESGGRAVNTYSVVEGDPLSAKVICDRQVTIGRGDWQTQVITSSTMTCDAENFYVTNLIDAYENGALIFSKTTSSQAPRDLV